MNGAEKLITSAIDCGIEICFANAGTTEMPILLALDRIKGIKAVLGLFEGVCTGAADGYGRMSGNPAMTLLHLGPGFANGIANLHNARRAHTPILNVIGEHATWHRPADPPLAMDIEGLAKTVSEWTRTNTITNDIPHDVAEAVEAASTGRIASLIVPHDHQLNPCDAERTVPSETPFAPVEDGEIKEAAGLLRTRPKTALFLGGRALRREGLAVAARIQGLTGCDLLTENFPTMVERGAGLPVVTRVPYFPEEAQALLSVYEGVILAGAKEPVTFFGYPGTNSHILRDDQDKVTIGTGRQDILEALAHLADALKGPAGGPLRERVVSEVQRPVIPHGELTPLKVSQTLAALQPEGAIIVEEGLTTSFEYYPLTASIPPHTILPITGGAIGYGMPCAVGAALACPERPVIDFQADGSAMYTIQALWTQARQGLNVTTLLCSNRSYRILQAELERAGIERPGKNAQALTELKEPTIDWVKIAEGFGVPAVSVKAVSELADALRRSLMEPGPSLIEMKL